MSTLINSRIPRDAATGNGHSLARWARALICVAAVATLAACGGGGGGGGSGASTSSNTSTTPTPPTTPPATTPPSTDSNALAVTVGAGPGNNTDIPYVTLTVCAPGNSSVCQTIDHVVLDTGSVGLRLAADALNPTMMAALTPITASNGGTLGACEQFLDGYTWGSMRSVDLTAGQMTAPSLPIQVFGDPLVGATAPATCTENGALLSRNTPQARAGNGILGVGGWQYDCGISCTGTGRDGTYYSCSGGACVTAGASYDQQAINPILKFATDNNGAMLVMPPVGATGAPTATGTLYFGLGTRANNTPNNPALIAQNFALSAPVSYNGQTYGDSFWDTGSSALFVPATTISHCLIGNGWLCPATTLSMATSVAAMDGSMAAMNISIANADSLFATGNYAFNNIGAANADTTSIDFGLPFFYGRTVGYAIENESALGKEGPFLALGQ